MNKDVFGQALTDYHRGKTDASLLLHNSYGEAEDMPVDVFFRSPEEFTELEHIALALCDGRTLDLGAGVGSHALHLQAQGIDVTALEISPLACGIMRQRGVARVVQADAFTYAGERFDTILMLMNGIGLAGTLSGVETLLSQCAKLLNEGGQLLFDSSDISYLYQDGDMPEPQTYRGEIQFQYEYGREVGDPFSWVYVDQNTLIEIAQRLGWVVQILHEDEYDQYLARMERRTW